MKNKQAYKFSCWQKWCFLLPLFLLFFMDIHAQVRIQQDTTDKDQVQIDFADETIYLRRAGTEIQRLIGNVELRQDSIYVYCDTVTITNDTALVAKGNVIIQQGDSLNVFADSLNYNTTIKVADLYGDVVLESNDQKLFTDHLTYDLKTKVATYLNRATITNGTTHLTSKRGYFYVDQDEAFFKDSVVVISPEFSLRSDTLKYNTKTSLATFLGPTLITNDSTKIYCEDGFYDIENRLAEFRQNAQYVRGQAEAQADVIRYDGATDTYTLAGDASFKEGNRNAKADTIRYDERADVTYLVGNAFYEDEGQQITANEIIYDAKTEVYKTKGRSYISDPPQILEADEVDYDNTAGLGVAMGNVIWRDTSENLTIIAELAQYNKKTDYLKASGGRPLLISVIDADSLFLSSDTLVGIRRDTIEAHNDSSRLMLAYPDVRIFKSNLQAICDSLSYSSADSLFQFFKDPIIWSDTSQFSADTIFMQLANDKIDRIYLYTKSFIINSPDEIFFNQIKGKDITAYFTDNDLQLMDVQGNAESVYYALDDFKAYVGVNKTVCSEMKVYFADNEVERIKFYERPQGELLPMREANHEELRLEGFRWETERRPRSVDDLLTLRVRPVIPVTEETETEETILQPEETEPTGEKE